MRTPDDRDEDLDPSYVPQEPDEDLGPGSFPTRGPVDSELFGDVRKDLPPPPRKKTD